MPQDNANAFFKSTEKPATSFFIVELIYKVGLEEVVKHLEAHRRFLDENYGKHNFIVSGAKEPRTGGIIFSSAQKLDDLMAIIKKDPFYTNQVADYKITEFHPTKYHPEFRNCLYLHSKTDADEIVIPRAKL